MTVSQLPLLTTLGLAAALAMDAFAVSMCAGAALPRISGRHYFRLSFHFGLFQFMMPVLGWLAGSAIHNILSAFDHWIAFGLLFLVGGKMILESFRRPEAKIHSDPTRGFSLLALSVATSIDALAVGLSLAFLSINIWWPSVIIGLVAALATATGLKIGDALGKAAGRRAELLGGLIIIAIGLKILTDHLL
jgi:putative Mn2+ efflux pump MntP